MFYHNQKVPGLICAVDRSVQVIDGAGIAVQRQEFLSVLCVIQEEPCRTYALIAVVVKVRQRVEVCRNESAGEGGSVGGWGGLLGLVGNGGQQVAVYDVEAVLHGSVEGIRKTVQGAVSGLEPVHRVEYVDAGVQEVGAGAGACHKRRQKY